MGEAYSRTRWYSHNAFLIQVWLETPAVLDDKQPKVLDRRLCPPVDLGLLSN